VDVDLIDHIRAQHPRRTLQGEQEINLCHSLNEKTRLFGGLKSPSTDALYKKALERPTKKQSSRIPRQAKGRTLGSNQTWN
jgi:hypothetical protein